MLFNNITEFKAVVGGSVNSSLDLNSIGPTIEHAFNLHLVPVLGEDYATAFIERYNSNDLTTDEQEKLLPKVRKAVALLTMYHYARVGAVQFSESGIHRIETETVRSAYRYQEEEYLREHLTQGYEAIEILQKALERNADLYTEYKLSNERKRHNACFVRYASELRLHYSKYVTRYAFECLRPLMEEVQTFAINGNLTDPFVEDILDKYAQNDLKPNERKLVDIIQKVIVEFTIKEGLARNWVQIDGNRVVHNEHADGVLRSDFLRASPDAVSLAMRHHSHKANLLVSKMLSFITDHESDFELAFCKNGFWNDDQTEWVDGIDDNWSYAFEGQRHCLLTAEQRSAKKPSDCCPERHVDAPTDLPTTSRCGSGGCGGHDSCGCGCSGHKKKGGIVYF